VEGRRSRISGSSDWARGIKLEEEKVKRVVDWLISKRVNGVQKFLGL